ncbi:MAG: hypothetical protein WA152_04675 [Microgenomates group bacterium]
MANLPTVGGDNGSWGTILNAYLQVAHASDGYHINDNVNTVADAGATEALDLSAYGVFDITLTVACTLTFSNPVPTGKLSSFLLIVRQNGTGGYALTYPASVKWDNGVAPTLTTTASKISILSFFTPDSGTTWFGSLVSDNCS